MSHKVWQRERRFPSGFDFWPYLKGATKAGLSLPVQTVQEIAEQYAVRRRAARRTRLGWRKSPGARRSLGWLPFKVRTVRYAHGQVCYAGKWLSLWDSCGLGGFELRAGSISEDARGRWYLNVCVKQPDFIGPRPVPPIEACVGIDLGLKDLAALSTGHKEAARQFYRIAGLGIREWTCSGCATTHDRDVNAAWNILAVGHGRLGAGIPHL